MNPWLFYFNAIFCPGSSPDSLLPVFLEYCVLHYSTGKFSLINWISLSRCLKFLLTGFRRSQITIPSPRSTRHWKKNSTIMSPGFFGDIAFMNSLFPIDIKFETYPSSSNLFWISIIVIGFSKQKKNYFPFHSGLRFATKASMPSFWSSVAKSR